MPSCHHFGQNQKVPPESFGLRVLTPLLPDYIRFFFFFIYRSKLWMPKVGPPGGFPGYDIKVQLRIIILQPGLRGSIKGM